MVKVIISKGKYKGIWFGEVACRKTGNFDVKNKEGKRILNSVNYKNFEIIQRFNGYSYKYNTI